MRARDGEKSSLREREFMQSIDYLREKKVLTKPSFSFSDPLLVDLRPNPDDDNDMPASTSTTCVVSKERRETETDQKKKISCNEISRKKASHQ